PDLAGFRLSVDGNQECEIADPAARQMDCPIYVGVDVLAITLTAFDTSGNESNVSNTFVLNPVVLPDSVFELSAPLDVRFSALSSTDSDGEIVSYSWDFGDGETGVGETVDHTYAVAGEYTATLTLMDNDGATTQVETVVVVLPGDQENIPPTSIITASPWTGEAPLTVSFSGSDSLDTDGSLVSYDWSFGDTQSGTGVAADHIYNNPGAYTVSLTVTDNQGEIAQSQATITVTEPQNTSPVAVDGALSTDEDAAASGTLSAIDLDDDSLTYAIVANGSLGSAVITNAATGAFTYTPDADANGVDTFTFKVNDGTEDSAIATMTVTISAVNDAPVASAGSLTVNED
ncbi:MAG: PKD domain-containing protein, partial [Desulfobulbaceae bacterium]|nr:PKD domain-containing protein [Desulfobulbaceae bacterium]